MRALRKGLGWPQERVGVEMGIEPSLSSVVILRHGEWCTVMVIATGEVVFQG